MGSEAILVLDDDPAFRALVALSLEVHGMPVVEAGSVEQALVLLAAGRYALVVSDHSLPGASGLELLERLRARGSRIPFVLMSGELPAGAAARAALLGATAVTKRPGLVDLHAAVDVSLGVRAAHPGGSGGRRAPAAAHA